MSKFVTALGLIILLLVAVARWRGCAWSDGVALVTPAGKLHAIGTHRGQVLVLFTDIAVRPPGKGRVKLLSASADAFDQMLKSLELNDTSVVNVLGVRATSGNSRIKDLSPAGGRTLIILPRWLPCFLAAAMLLAPAMRRRHPAGHCRTCGYDLRGSRERCPECGTAFDDANSLASVAAGS